MNCSKELFSGVRKEGRGYYVAWLNGEIVGSAPNMAAAKEKFNKQVERAQMNAQRDAATAAWSAKRAEIEYSFAERNGMVAA